MSLALLLQRWLPPTVGKRRPFELVYAADECPPRGALALLSLQHVATVLALITHVLAAAKLAGLPLPQTHSIVAVTLLGMALGTALQAWGGRIGSGALLVFQPDPMMITVAGTAIASAGVGALVEMTLLTAVVTLCIGPLMRHLRPLFPPPVVGTVICMGGLGLVEPAVRNALGVNAQMQVDPVSALTSGAALAAVITLSVWGGRRLRLFGLMTGVVFGLLIAALNGRLGGVEALAGTPLLALPQPIAPSFALGPEIIAAIVLIAALNQLDNIGCLIVMDKTNDADWRRADMGMVGRGIRANGIADLLAGLFGSFPSAPSSANIALVHATGSSSRYIGLATGALLLLIAMSPRLTLALTLVPQAVLGAVELYAAAYLIVSGIEMIATRALDSRGVFMVGLALCAGLATMLMPGLARGLPASLHVLAGDGFVVAGLLVVLLNLVIRLGTKRQAQLLIDPMGGPISQQITDFVERQGRAWAARADVVRRAAQAALEASEAIAAAGHGRPLSLAGRFDEFNLELELLYRGEALPLHAQGDTVDLDALLKHDDEQALDAAMQRVSRALLRQMADKVSSAPAGADLALLRLHFDH